MDHSNIPSTCTLGRTSPGNITSWGRKLAVPAMLNRCVLSPTILLHFRPHERQSTGKGQRRDKGLYRGGAMRGLPETQRTAAVDRRRPRWTMESFWNRRGGLGRNWPVESEVRPKNGACREEHGEVQTCSDEGRSSLSCRRTMDMRRRYAPIYGRIMVSADRS